VRHPEAIHEHNAMPRKQKLKVFRTSIGFHDAYVAAPSRKAALEAWGAELDLFARGIAEQVDDPALTREPLDQPGKIIRRSRGDVAEQLAALPATPLSKAKEGRPEPAPPVRRQAKPAPARKSSPSRPKKSSKPRPGDAALRAAERAVEETEARHNEERAAIAVRRAKLDRERRALEKRQVSERAKVERQVDEARTAYDRAIRAWRS